MYTQQKITGKSLRLAQGEKWDTLVYNANQKYTMLIKSIYNEKYTITMKRRHDKTM